MLKKWIKQQTSLAFRVQVRHIANYFNLLMPFPRLPVVKFVIFGQGRTGSQLLVDLLNSHPSIYCDSEIFHPYYFGKAIAPYWHIVSCSRKAGRLRKQAYGFKVKFYQLEKDQGIDPHQLIHQLHRKGWKIIYLSRRNVLRHALSNLKADRDQVYHRQDQEGHPGNGQNEKLTVNCEQLHRYMKGHEQFTETEMGILNNLPHLEVVYEDDLLNSEVHQQTMNKVFQFLGVEQQPVQTNYVRTSHENLEDLIDNYEEVEHYFRHSKYERYLQ